MNNGLERIWETKQLWPNGRYYPDICLEGLREIWKTSVRKAGLRAKIWTQEAPRHEVVCIVPRKQVK
ncbi:hypothetical protein L798_04594 [Zootermopsis nevadensis]|uniref:Uncharacterized protein n=1 Tax=Zootermopsis nevadensis TaxID=136037 RepID=A0A067RA25_ZOONE|nr:hypothetical protein L798_04594 [Zootermopsis nevadensis]